MKQYSYHKIAGSIDDLQVNENGLTELEVSGKKICLALNNQKLYACAAKCPHAGGRLADGYIDHLGNIVCPVHRYRFSLAKGHNTSGEGYYLKTYPIEQREDGIYIGLEAGGLFNWLK